MTEHLRTLGDTAKAAAPGNDWSQARERSSLWVLRLMAWIATTLGRPVARCVLHPITLYFVLFAPRARRQSARYLARALARPARFGDLYRHVHCFASTVLDRVYLVRGQLGAFDIAQGGVEPLDATLAEGRGAVLLGAHIGSFEVLHATGESRPGMRVAMVMYPDNARMIQQVLQSIAPNMHLDVIAIGRSGSTLAIRDWLDAGGVAGLLADRFLPTASGRSAATTLPFLGAPAQFSDGPLRLAMLLRRRVFFMVGLYRGGNRYEVSFKVLADFSQPIDTAAQREAALQAALAAYVAQLESLCRDAPYNWFNFHDFWRTDTPA
jgi:predicted LPLAT superfamily acyltransferase